MIAGILEIQMMTNLARLSDDMRRAERVVGDSMNKVERSVSSASRAMSSLGAGLSVALILDQARRMSDAYTKMDAQIRLSTKSQQSYNQALSDIRRISTIAQADISATSMLYTRLLNTTEGMGISQSKLATVTETVTFGLKAYGATSAEAASAALQLSQAMGANRLGGEEFRAVMEAMPNVMKVLADSMGVPLGELRALSIAGKITTEEMVKAFGDPRVAEEFKRMAESARTITGAWTVARNEMMLLFGEFMKASGATGAIMASFDGVAVVIRLIADNLGLVITALTLYASILIGKFTTALVVARTEQIALNIAHGEALAMNLAIARSEEAAALAARDAAAARAWQTGVTNGATAANARYAASVAETAAAERLMVSNSIGWFDRLKNSIGKGGLFGIALFGVYELFNFLSDMDKIWGKASTVMSDLAAKTKEMNIQQLVQARQMEQVNLTLMKHSVFSKFNEAEIRAAQDKIRIYDDAIAKAKELEQKQMAAAPGAGGPAFTHDQMVTLTKYNALLEQKEKFGLKEAEFEKAVRELYLGNAKDRKKGMSEEADARKRFLALEEAYWDDYYASLDDKRKADEARDKKAKEDALKRQMDLVGRIEGVFKSGFEAIASGANNVWQVMRDGFKKIFVDFLYETFAKKYVLNVIGGIAGSLGMAGMAEAATSAGGTGSAAVASSLTPYMAPVAAVAAAYVIAKYGFGWGNQAERVGGPRLVGQFSRSGFRGGMEQDWMRQGGLFTSDQRWVERTAISTAQQRAFKSTVDGLQRVFNALGSAIGDTSVKTRDWTVNVNQAGDVTAVLANGMGAQLIPALQDLRMEGETLAQTAVRLTTVFQSTNDFIAALGVSSMQAFGAAGVLSATQRTDLVTAAGGDQAFSSLAGSFISNILTPADQLQVSLNRVGRVFSELNVAGVETNAQFAELVRNALTAGDYSAVGALLSVSDAFAAVTKSAQTATDQLLALVKASSFSTFADYQRMKSSIAATAKTPTIPTVPVSVSGQITAATSQAGGVLAQEQLASVKANKIAALNALNAAIAEPLPTGMPGMIARQIHDANVANAQRLYDSLPAFAAGGTHVGGLRLVGENGPEVEYTGPSTIYSNSDSRKMFDNTPVVESIDALRAELRAIGIAVVAPVQKQAKILDRWDGQGMPETRTV